MAIPTLASDAQQDIGQSPLSDEKAASAAHLSLLDYFVVIVEHKRAVLSITAAFGVVILILSYVLPAQYTATVSLLPPQQNSSLSSTLASQFGGGATGMAALALGGGSLSLKNPNDMYVGLLKSRTVEDAVVQRFGLMQQYRVKFPTDARSKLENHMKIDGNGKDGLIHISVRDSDPKRAAEIANGYIAQFRDLSEHLAITEASQRRLFFEEQLQQSKENLANAEEAMKRTQQQTGVIEPDSQARALIETAATLRAQIAAREVELGSLETFATNQNAQLVQLQQQLATLRAQLAKLGGSESDPEGSLIVPEGKVPEASLEYLRRLRDVKYNETIFNILAKQFELAKLDEAREGSIIQVVDSAVPPDKRSFPQRKMMVLGGLIAGLLIGIFFALSRAAYENLQAEPLTSRKLRLLRQAIGMRR